MGEGPRQLLVILDRARAKEAQAELRRRFTVSDVASPRLLLLRDEGDHAAEVRAVAGVESVIDREIPTRLLESFDEGELLFARAWENRQRSGPKERTGEGLSWDSPGFTPPDPPR